VKQDIITASSKLRVSGKIDVEILYFKTKEHTFSRLSVLAGSADLFPVADVYFTTLRTRKKED